MTPGARARRALIVDVVAAALIAVLALSLTAGLGVVAFFALPLLLLGLLWIAVERLVVWLRRRRRQAG
jgi:predicted PurR-regulated permease PerM